MKYKRLFKKIRSEIEEHVSTIGYLSNSRGTIPIRNMDALLLRFKAICDGKSLEEAIKIQTNFMRYK